VNPSPLVSIIVRSRGFGGLLAALNSIAAQSYRSIEVIVVDTTGHPDSAWPTIEWPAGFEVHWFCGHQRLSDARAANLALDAVHGAYFCFLDDNGVFDARHVEQLVRATAHRPDALVHYGRARVTAPGGAADAVVGRPLNRALFFHDQLFCLPAALIRSSAIEGGCRFDEQLELGAEHDFLEQIALRGEFVFLANAPPTSHCGARDGDDARAHAGTAQRLYFDNLRFAKWTGERVHHGLRAAFLSARAARRLEAGEVDAARTAFDDILAIYPGDPDALHGMARCELAAGRLQPAWQHILEAMDFEPANADYRRTAESIRQRSGAGEIASAARESASRFRFVAGEPASAAPAGVPAQVELSAHALVAARGVPCPCGSGKRYKHCCGRLSSAMPSSETAGSMPTAGDTVRRARALLQIGAASEAAALLSRVAPLEIVDAQVALDAGEAYARMHLLQPAFALFERAIELDPGLHEAMAACDECCQLMFRASAWQSAGRSIRALLERQNGGSEPARRRPAEIHIVCKLDTVGGTERRALNLYQELSAHARVTLWTTVPPLAAHGAEVPLRLIAAANAPSGGTLVLVGTYFACGDWLETAPFERVVICHNLAEQYASLMQRLIQIGDNPARPPIELTFPSQLFRETSGLPGVVEYSAVDVEAFQRRTAPGGHRTRLVVGRHGRAYPLKFHPNDPAFFRSLIARGYDVRILGGAPVVAAFAAESGPRPELLDVNAESARDFLERLDVFVYRKHPRFFETGGTAVLEAMAMELPVVVFPEQCGIAEIIRDGENGFLVGSEPEAIEVIDRLALDRELRSAVGRAARVTVVALMREQRPRLLDFYLGVRGGAAAPRASSWWKRLLAWPRSAATRRVDYAGDKR
jgi:tetratricopeptide (TPR) repeat protein